MSMTDAGSPSGTERRFARFRLVLASGLMAMIGLSLPLWLGTDGWPRVPVVAGWPEPARGWAAAWAILIVGSTGLVALGRGGRWSWLVSVAGVVGLVLGDQDRGQPWVQQYVAVGSAVLLLGARRERVVGLARWYVVILYAASGLSKLDAAFADELGPAFLRALGGRLGFDPDRWSPATRTLAALALPGAEVAIALALVVPATRALGLMGSVVQHLATLLILGPGGLDHSAIVLVWNAAILVENLILFGGSRRSWVPGGGACLIAVAVVAILAVGERSGLVDSWPGHALYASHAEVAALDWPDARSDDLPPTIRRFLGPPDAEGYRRLDLTAWSRAARGVPVYPQNRVACGVAEALVERHGATSGPPVRLILRGRAGIARVPARDRVECLGLRAIRRRGDRFLLNAHPAPGFGRDP